MDVEFYRNFLVVAESSNLSAAAHKLNIAQTSLSAQIHKLESCYGVRLLKRQKGIKAIELTSAGIDFLRQAEQICKSEDELAFDMQKYSGAVSGTLRFGVSHLRSSYIIEQFLAPFSQLHPEIMYEYDIILTIEQVEKIRAGSIDFAFANTAIPAYPEFSIVNLGTEQFYAIYRSDTPTAWENKNYITVEDLQNLPLCSNKMQFPILRQVCDERFITLRVNFMTNTLGSCLDLVRNSNNIAIAAMLPNDKLPSGLTRTLIKNDKLFFNQTFFWNKSRPLSIAAQKFLDFFLEQNKNI